MRLLFIGDITASAGRRILDQQLPLLREQYAPHIVIANVENSAHGIGVTPKMIEHFLAIGVDVMTGGNHLYDRKEILEYLVKQPRILKPANFSADTPGHRIYMGEADGAPFIIATLLGRTFMQPNDSPFLVFDKIVEKEVPEVAVRIFDFHAEATSEKFALARHADGRASAILGTHTHVQTADEQILPGGTAYITDVGMTGPHSGIIGMSTKGVLKRFLTGLPTRFEPAQENVQLHAVVVDIDGAGGHATAIQRIRCFDREGEERE